MNMLFSRLHSYRHRVGAGDLTVIPTDHACYRISVDHPGIRKTQFSDVMVRSFDGIEPARGFSKRGNGSVFRDIRIDDGHAEMILEDSRNQTITNPVGMKLIFIS